MFSALSRGPAPSRSTNHPVSVARARSVLQAQWWVDVAAWTSRSQPLPERHSSSLLQPVSRPALRQPSCRHAPC